MNKQRVWKYQVTLTDHRSFVVSVFSADRDPSTVLRPELRDMILDVTTLESVG